MVNLSGDAFVQALQSETVTLLVGPAAEPIIVSKALLRLKSDTLATLLSKPGLNQLELPGIGVDVSKTFVCWCYQDRLQELPLKAPLPERKQIKELLIDLWLFADVYNIYRLQNQAMKHLIHLFATPSLLAEPDIAYIWSRGDGTSTAPLKDLAVCTLVAQLEGPNATKTIADFDELARKLPGFTAKVYKALRFWMEFAVHGNTKKTVNKWHMMLQDEVVRKGLMVETKRVGSTGAGRVLPERSAPVPFAPGEVIEID
ncbi:hypothetical protein LTR08_008707 [Meristemomyces frigidus]|nr:hypothetical protein LTR08_008707 [Meristemomyces frigidus]